MKEILFASSNNAKKLRYSKGLLDHGIVIKNLKDVGITLTHEENGSSAIENALIKAKEVYSLTHKATFAVDDSLYISGIPESLQPGLFVRRVGGKDALTDEEVLNYYTNLVKKYAPDDKLECKWVYGLAVINDEGKKFTYSWSTRPFYMTSKVSKTIKEGYPLDSISKYYELDKYFAELTDEDKALVKDDESHVTDFIAGNI